MPKNKLTDLNDHLFLQMERLGDEDLKGDQLKAEIDRSRTMSDLGRTIVASYKTTLDAFKLMKNGHVTKGELPIGLIADGPAKT